MKQRFSYQEQLLYWSKKHKKRLTFHTAVLTAFLGALLLTSDMWTYEPPVPEVKKDSDALLTCTFVGDMMFGRYISKVIDRKGYDFLFKFTDPYFQISDFSTGSFKHPLLTENRQPAPGKSKGTVFSADPLAVEELKKRHFRSVSIANTNIYDYGYLAFRDTITYFENDPDIDAAGHMIDREDMSNAVYYDHNGITIATVAATDKWTANAAVTTYRPGVMPLDPPEIVVESIVQAKKQADLVIVHAHWGEPYDSHVSERQRELAHAMARAGADIIVGHYPHVLAPVEVYNDTIIFYSLGNFIFDQGWTRTKQTAMAQYRLYEDGRAEVELIPFVIREGQPRPVSTISYRQFSIQQMLTKNFEKGQWEKIEENIVFKVNHSRVIQTGKLFEEGADSGTG
ncbi:poly-gamma-glutamate synthesis protein (capsule biosynthesis protein) [Evansella caseinilytica]|uniref:Poly-gamma-glutamate synthesis protein (Capsule biosynthesis protein) n=1 Tax=Evansella caseinilytica TaxID=1503961 RepID=A0A1H3T862_9BACI|nr:CapA family protein [Evansella caseinilytica]SDZ46404.1 poly-gamma-glutamate synthesis protein (capsule biosynthesis protein) [Evansella caseinilytica]